MTTTSTTTTSVTTSELSSFQREVLAGIAAGEVRRVILPGGRRYRMDWHKPTGHRTNFGTVYHRFPTHTVEQLIELGLARLSARFPDFVAATRKGKASLGRINQERARALAES